MRTGKKVRIVASALLGALIFVFAITPLIFRERKYEGKTIREWIYALNSHYLARTQDDHASEALIRIGTNCVPVISSILSERNQQGLSERFHILAQKFGLIPREALQLAERQSHAARAAYKLAEGADVDISSLVPLLSHQLTNLNSAGEENARALANAGPAGIAVLTNQASHPDTRIRYRAVFYLQYAPKVPGVFEAYFRASDDPDEKIRFCALSSLAKYPDADPALLLPIGLAHSKSTNVNDRWAATKLLARYKTNHLATAALSNAMADPDTNVRAFAKRFLNKKDFHPAESASLATHLAD